MESRSVSALVRVIEGFFENTYLKAVAGLGLSLVSFLFDPATFTALVALLVLIIADFATSLVAIRKTGKSKRGQPFASYSVFGSAVKTVVYFTMVAAGFLTEKAVPIPFIDDTIIGFLALTELISILENAGHAGYAVPKKLLEKLTKARGES